MKLLILIKLRRDVWWSHSVDVRIKNWRFQVVYYLFGVVQDNNQEESKYKLEHSRF